MKKKGRSRASKAAKAGKSGAAGRKPALLRAQAAPRRSATPKTALKPINDAFGHAAGDKVLQAIAEKLASEVRASDVIGRLGGDEFAVLLWNLSETDARAKAAMLEEAIDGLRISFGGSTVQTGASV